jgi:hypothetical protein
LSITTENGIVLTDEMLERIKEAFEQGEWPGTDNRLPVDHLQ